jgi:hypothetical protein
MQLVGLRADKKEIELWMMRKIVIGEKHSCNS